MVNSCSSQRHIAESVLVATNKKHLVYSCGVNYIKSGVFLQEERKKNVHFVAVKTQNSRYCCGSNIRK
jgi:hypothetical protein